MDPFLFHSSFSMMVSNHQIFTKNLLNQSDASLFGTVCSLAPVAGKKFHLLQPEVSIHKEMLYYKSNLVDSLSYIRVLIATE